MEKDKLESLLIDYIDGKLNTIDRQMVEKELTSNAASYKLYEQLQEVMHMMDRAEMITPSEKMKAVFSENLKQAIADEGNTSTKTLFFTPLMYKVAAAVLLVVVGGSIGFWLSQQHQQSQQIAALKKEMEDQRKLIVSQLGDDQSAGNRILAVHAANEVQRPGDEIVDALIKTMNEDPNSNVRLAALDALGKFHRDSKVRKALIDALSTQQDPVVQLALIQLMVQIKEKGALKSLQKISEDEDLLPAVKDEAYAGVVRLSES